LSVRIFYDGVKEKIIGQAGVKELVREVVRGEYRTAGDLVFIVTTDEELLKINREFLKRDYLTDVIAFNYSWDKVVEGEIYVSYETVRENSRQYGVPLIEELVRVIIHGVLHLCGYDDSTEELQEIMRKKEDEWIEKYFRGGWNSDTT
jgi:probable rRNA maturation factor